jgi:putative transposase
MKFSEKRQHILRRHRSPAPSKDDCLHKRASRRLGYRAGLQGFANRQSIFYAYVAIARNPHLASDRAKRDVMLSREIKRVWEQNNKVYATRKVWHQLQREKVTIAHCTVAGLMKHLAIQGVIRGKVKKTTVPDKVQPRPKDKGNRKVQAPAPNMLWVSDFTHVSIWQGVVYVAFITDTFADKIVG